MKIQYLVSGAFICAASLSVAIAAPQVAGMASQVATESTVVNHAEGGSITMRTSLSDACPVGDSGQRRQVFPIRFQRPFTDNKYVATVGLSVADIDHARNIRIAASVEDRTRDGMTIVAYTWCNTNIYTATFNYAAIGR